MSSEFVTLYCTCSSLEEAKNIGKELVEEGLVACVNIIQNINSIYKWNGKIQDEKEFLIIGKTRKSLSIKIKKRIKELHSYSVPCITFLPISEGNKDYLKWIKGQTS